MLRPAVCSATFARPRARLAALGCVIALMLCGVPPVRAAVVRPWTPAGADSITSLVAEAKLRFQQAQVDSLDEQGIVPFERVGQAARRLLRRLGRQHMLEASSIEASLDSLGLDTDVVNDPELPSIVLVMVRNPYRQSQQAVGYLLWYRGLDLRMQGASFPACVRPRVRSWTSARTGAPYSTAILYEERGIAPRLGFKFLKLSSDGFYWNLVQYEGNGPDLGLAGDATFADLNRDGLPELLSYSPVPPDSVLQILAPAQPLLREVIYTDRGRGFVAHDARIVPGPMATLRLFVSLLREGNRDGAKRLLLNPEYLELAVAAGWDKTRSPRDFVVDRQEEGQAWPERLGVRVRTARGMQRWAFHFALKDGLWFIKDCLAEEAPRPDAARSGPADSTGGHRP
jgi:hypothetical protein